VVNRRRDGADSARGPGGDGPPGAGGDVAVDVTADVAADLAADLVVGRRTLLALRVVFVGAVALFFGLGAVNAAAGRTVLTPPMGVWTVTAAAALAALLVCRRPARRVPDLTYSIAVAAACSAFVGALGLVAGFSVVVAPAVACGLLTIALLYAERGRGGPR
jgi:hypothetical protein